MWIQKHFNLRVHLKKVNADKVSKVAIEFKKKTHTWQEKS